MPLNVRKFCAFISLVFVFVIGLYAQAPTSADVMRARVSKAKAFVAIKNYAAAIYELEGIKRETNDPTVNGVVQVMLMNCYLEQLDYKRAQSLLTETFTFQKADKPNSNYFAIAGQVVRSAKSQLERYKSLGLSVSDRNLPTEAVADLDKMRETVETVIEQSNALVDNKKIAPDSMALLEEAAAARSNLGRDEYDAKRWREQVSDAREQLMNSRSRVINTVDDGTPSVIDTTKLLATNITPSGSNNPTVVQNAPLTETKIITVNSPPADSSSAPQNIKAEPTPNVEKIVEKIEATAPADNAAADQAKAEMAIINNSPMQIGSLIEYATERVNPAYPPAARTMRITGTVKVEVLVGEDGSIAEVQKTSGPSILQRAAVDAVKHWKFKPFVRDGQNVKAEGFVNFSFNL